MASSCLSPAARGFMIVRSADRSQRPRRLAKSHYSCDHVFCFIIENCVLHKIGCPVVSLRSLGCMDLCGATSAGDMHMHLMLTQPKGFLVFPFHLRAQIE
jgi:hypothetical protein